MFISKISVQPVSTPDFWRKVTVNEDKSGYPIHQWIWQLFSDTPDRKRDFIYRHDATPSGHVFLTVSHRRPESMDQFLKIDVKDYHPEIKNGMRLGFLLRANPIRAVRDEDKKLKRHDVVMDSKKKLLASGKKKEEILNPEVIQEAGLQWLMSKGDTHGFQVEPGAMRADGYRGMDLPNKGKNARISILEFNGLLTVTNAEKFKEALFKGVGPAKGFGCGLLLVRRI